MERNKKHLYALKESPAQFCAGFLLYRKIKDFHTKQRLH